MADPEALSNRGLIGYAVLRANFNSSAPSYIDNFGDYVLDTLARNDPTALSEAEVARDVREHFGFTIPDRVVGKILSKAVTRRTVERVSPPRGQDRAPRFHLRSGQLEKMPDLQTEISRFERQARDLALKFTDYVSQEYPEHLHLIELEPSQHLGNYVERHAIPLLSEAMGRGPAKSGTEDRGITGTDFLVNAFLRHIGDADAVAFGYVVELVKGAILAAVVDLGTGELTRRLTAVHVVVDTPVLLKALGFQGPQQQVAVTQTLDLARQNGIHLHCFEHTIKELEGVLLSVAPVLKSRGASGGSLRAVDSYFLDQGLTPADVSLEVRKLDDRIRALGLEELAAPGHRYEYGLDEVKLEDLLQKQIGYRFEGTRRYDVDSLSSIHRLRGGSCGNDFARCKYVLVTDNDRLASASKRVDERHGWPLAMLDADLAALLWVRSPGVNEDLPRTQLLATVYSGMQPGSHLWAKYLQGIEELRERGEVTDEDAILMRAPEGRDALMAETLGDDAISADTALAVLHRVQEEMSEPYRRESRRAEESRDAAVTAADQAIADRSAAESERDRLASDAEKLSRKVGDLEKDISDRRAAEKHRDQALRHSARKAARRIIVSLILLLVLTLTLFFAISLTSPQFLRSWPSWIPKGALVSAIIVAVLGILGDSLGGSLREWLTPVESWLARHIEGRKRKRAGLPEISPSVAGDAAPSDTR